MDSPVYAKTYFANSANGLIQNITTGTIALLDFAKLGKPTLPTSHILIKLKMLIIFTISLTIFTSKCFFSELCYASLLSNPRENKTGNSEK